MTNTYKRYSKRLYRWKFAFWHTDTNASGCAGEVYIENTYNQEDFLKRLL